MDGGRVRPQLTGQLQGVGPGVLLLHPSDDEGGQVLGGLNVEASAGRHLDGSAAPGPLDVFGVTGEGAGDREDFSRLNADVLRQSLDPGRRAWRPQRGEEVISYFSLDCGI